MTEQACEWALADIIQRYHEAELASWQRQRSSEELSALVRRLSGEPEAQSELVGQ